MTVHDFLEACNANLRANPGWRFGQTVANTADQLFGQDVADIDVDPYYRDANIDPYIRELQRHGLLEY